MMVPGVGAVAIGERDGVMTLRRAAAIGRALFAYIRDPVVLPEDHPRFAGHSNQWDSRALAHALLRLGFDVDAVDFDAPHPDRPGYDLYVGGEAALWRWRHRLPPAARTIALITHADPVFSNDRERERVAALTARRGGAYRPRRQFPNHTDVRAALELADAVILNGGEWTRSTLPPAIAAKTVTLSPSANPVADAPVGAAPSRFLWFGGAGLVHKGLDLTLDAFLPRPEWQLDLVGVLDEPDFWALYPEAARATNLHPHGFLPAGGVRGGGRAMSGDHRPFLRRRAIGGAGHGDAIRADPDHDA
jgi:hypothetical protein